MLIEVIRLDNNFLTIKVGNTRQECLESKAFDLPTRGRVDLYSTLTINRMMVEDHLKSNKKTELINHVFPSGNIPVTEL